MQNKEKGTKSVDPAEIESAVQSDSPEEVYGALSSDISKENAPEPSEINVEDLPDDKVTQPETEETHDKLIQPDCAQKEGLSATDAHIGSTINPQDEDLIPSKVAFYNLNSRIEHIQLKTFIV